MYDHKFYIYIYYIFLMVKKVLNPKILIHLTISPDMKKFLIDNNINASELLEKAIIELMNISKNEANENIFDYYADIKRRLESEKILTHPAHFEDKAYFREMQIRAMNILRYKLGFDYEDAKRLLERYIKDKRQEIEDLGDLSDRYFKDKD